jgi:hypothetical protein
MSDDNVVQLQQPEPPELLIGPFKVWKVQVDGRIIPRLTGFHDGDKIAIIVDGRFSHSFAKEDAYQAAWLIAQAMAIGQGYAHLGADNKERPFAPQGCAISSLPDKD